MENTINLKLPLLISNQSQKEITHNEALTIIDNILQNGIIDKDLATPPSSPNSNDLYIIGTSATGTWANKDGYLAFYDNGWRFIQAREGFTFWVNDEDCLYTYNGTIWKKTLEATGATVGSLDDLSDVVITSASQYDLLQHNGTNFINTKEIQNLSLLGINTAADSTNKLSVKSDAILFDKATANSQVKVNKASSTDTASHLFQTGYSGRAEFGLTGSDDFTLKVSSNGSTWNNSFVVDKSTGNIDFKGTITNNSEYVSYGNWINNYLSLAEGTTISSGGVLNYSLSSYLPNDSNKYDVIFGIYSIATSTSETQIVVKSDLITNYYWLCSSKGVSVASCGTTIIPTGSAKTLYVANLGGGNGTIYARVFGYRRVK